jgi:hypothetical protein
MCLIQPVQTTKQRPVGKQANDAQGNFPVRHSDVLKSNTGITC